MARGDFPLNRHRLKLRTVVARPRVRAGSRRSVGRSQTKRFDMQIKETPDVSFSGVIGSPAPEDVVVFADSAAVAIGVRAFSAGVRSVRDDGSGLIASRCVEIPLVG